MAARCRLGRRDRRCREAGRCTGAGRVGKRSRAPGGSHHGDAGYPERQTLREGDADHGLYDVLEYLAGGMSEDDILSDFPSLTRDDVRACLAFAAARERRLASSGAA